MLGVNLALVTNGQKCGNMANDEIMFAKDSSIGGKVNAC
jgi:hypothetical protein